MLQKSRQTLPVDEIKHLLDEGMRQIDVAALYNVTQSAISRLVSKPRVAENKSQNIRMCSCCGSRPLAKGNWFLCEICYSRETTEEHPVRV
jgi:heterodisulfide reductase subunit A-like polyferredoxin